MKNSSFFVGLFLVPIAFFSIQSTASSIEETALYKYVHNNEDQKVQYEPRFSAKKQGLDIRVYNVASQEWQGHKLYNQVYVALPENVPRETTHGVVVIAGGSFKEKYLGPPDEAEKRKFERKLTTYAMIANRLDTPIVVVRNVPFQRMALCPETFPEGKDGNSEDDLIACTFKKYLETGDENWPALLPMTRSVHEALDVAQEVFASEWGMNIKTFTALGASKRGWTTFLSSAVDDRITGAVPMVIDMLNMQEHLNLQVAAWGDYSRQIRDYDNHGVLSRFSTERGKRLIEIVDPFTYREEYDIPMLLILGTNDEYWPVDSANLYFPDLGADKYLLYLPNQGHKAADYARLLAASQALHLSVENGFSLPNISWSFSEVEDELSLVMSTDITPTKITLWRADSPNRDFRESSFTAKNICNSSTRYGPRGFQRRGKDCKDIYELSVDTSNSGCSSYYVEFWFEHDGAKKYPLTTTQHVTGGEACLSTGYMTASTGEAGPEDGVATVDE